MEDAKERMRLYKNEDRRDAGLQRRARAESAVKLRREKRDQKMQARRALSDDGGVVCATTLAAVHQDAAAALALNTAPEVLLARLTALRKAVSNGEHWGSTAADLALPRAVVAPLVRLLAQSFTNKNTTTNLSAAAAGEVAMALVNLTSGPTELCEAVAAAPDGGVVTLMRAACEAAAAGHLAVAESLTWALGNVAGDGAPARDHLLAQGAVAFLEALAAQNPPPKLVTQMSFLVGNLMRHAPPPTAIDAAWPALLWLLAQPVSPTVSNGDGMADVLWGLVHVLSQDEGYAKRLAQADGALQRLVALTAAVALQTEAASMTPEAAHNLLMPALRVLGLLAAVTSDDESGGDGSPAMDALLLDADERLPEALAAVAQSAPNYLRKEALFVLSNLAIGPAAQVARVAAAPGLAVALTAALKNRNFDVRDEATYVLYALAGLADDAEAGVPAAQALVREMTAAGALGALADLLHGSAAAPPDQIMRVLDVLEMALTNDAALRQFEEEGGAEGVDMLLMHENEGVHLKAVLLNDHFFLEEKEKEDG